MQIKHGVLLCVLSLLLSGCGVKAKKQALDGQLAVLAVKQAGLNAKLAPYARLGAYKNGQCQQVGRGPLPVFSCGSPETETKVPTMLCGIYAARYCLRVIDTAFRDSGASSFCAQTITKNFQETNSSGLFLALMNDEHVVKAMQQCEGVLCQPADPAVLYQDKYLVERITLSTASCEAHLRSACRQYYQEWYERPEKLESECRQLAQDLAPVTQEIATLEHKLDLLKRSFKYKLLYLVGAV